MLPQGSSVRAWRHDCTLTWKLERSLFHQPRILLRKSEREITSRCAGVCDEESVHRSKNHNPQNRHNGSDGDRGETEQKAEEAAPHGRPGPTPGRPGEDGRTRPPPEEEEGVTPTRPV
ncbi:hypothetical protein THAOC_21451, partial [Thalassiosira oceanica]